MAGAGEHLHRQILRYTGMDYKPGCGCRALALEMDKHDPDWSLENISMILNKLRGEAKGRGWFMRAIAALPGIRLPLRWMIVRAVESAKKDLANGS
jgi:hypothetical protein